MYLGKRTALQRSGRHDWPAAGTFRASNPPKQAPPQVRPDDPGTPSPRAISSDWSRYIASRSDSPRQCWSTGISVQSVPTCCSAAFLAFGSRSSAPPQVPLGLAAPATSHLCSSLAAIGWLPMLVDPLVALVWPLC
ncbi:hypothetical protein JX266_003069 [Neoarthrinium moseri]|nr:hypothetical protein JX266_003069 [Neoarthrinium moseri]